jgi:hypothetical protein
LRLLSSSFKQILLGAQQWRCTIEHALLSGIIEGCETEWPRVKRHKSSGINHCIRMWLSSKLLDVFNHLCYLIYLQATIPVSIVI